MKKESMLAIVGILMVGVLLLFVFDYAGIPLGQGTGGKVNLSAKD